MTVPEGDEMSELERLDEAADRLLSHGDPVLWAVADGQLLARFYRDLLVNGERVEWCETHGCSDIADESHRGGDYIEEHCVHGEWIVGESPSLDTWNCHIGDRLLVDPPKEEDR